MKIIFCLILQLLTSVIVGNGQGSKQVYDSKKDDFFSGFVSPPSEARPFVRWWWNGNQITANEIKRQLDVLKTAGIGGVEINPIGMPEEAIDIGAKEIEWLSSEWNQLLVLAAKEAKKRGLISDLIVGSGWPFGGEFLKESETIQRVITNTISYSGGSEIIEDEASLIQKAITAQSRPSHEKPQSNELIFISLIPVNAARTSAIIDLTTITKEKDKLIFKVPEGDHQLVYGIRQRGHRQVMHGALGAAGPVMNHFDKNVTLAYLNRLKKISNDTGIPLSELFRALFCDSIELGGANWTDGLSEVFYKAYHYGLEPYFPFIFNETYQAFPAGYSNLFSDEIKRVRYDYNELLVKVFLDNFTRTFHQFCTENGLKSRYQAYGTPFLMGMTEGNMIPDIPESNNWIYSANMNDGEWSWNQGHGYMMWNLYAASGGHLGGKKIISCESMTNTRGVFKTSLEEIKRNDDMNFISGMNHTILHGYNYSPPEAGFPGWIRYGSYFSEQNTWWPYFSKWADYNARLSYVFQESQAVKNIAILGPTGDLWSTKGLGRIPFHLEPWYCNRLWEPLSQAGSSCDYISEAIIMDGKKMNSTLQYGPMSYQAIILSSIKSLQPETANSLSAFVKNGGKLVLIDSIPSRSLSYKNAAINDAEVQKIFALMRQKYPARILHVKSPASEKELLPWTEKLLQQLSISKDLETAVPDKNVFQIRQKKGDKDIFFFTNTHLTKSASLDVSFPTKGKTPWIWNPEDGTRKVFAFDKSKNKLTIKLKGLESLLLVFEPNLKGEPGKISNDKSDKVLVTNIESSWQLKFKHMNGISFNRRFSKLIDFSTSNDTQLNEFAGTVSYTTTFISDGTGEWLDLEKVNKGITELYLNGKKVGLNWYGRPSFAIGNKLLKGQNTIEIKYTTVLSNYSRSLKNNPAAERWTKGFEKIPMGLEGVVGIYK